ncbi:hypothetical protein [Niallia nealsonii]|uniref:Uncharacterized protein n=1 Tax=Niallia nealsonii TaxID=115979 RepID=A0A2N0Z325_9BACI|nr:hypothetical protein [Niallia nealsonii]PKG23923.1 hypothetical protein CWS01_09120 [Niallia nealsonii]
MKEKQLLTESNKSKATAATVANDSVILDGEKIADELFKKINVKQPSNTAATVNESEVINVNRERKKLGLVPIDDSLANENLKLK